MTPVLMIAVDDDGLHMLNAARLSITRFWFLLGYRADEWPRDQAPPTPHRVTCDRIDLDELDAWHDCLHYWLQVAQEIMDSDEDDTTRILREGGSLRPEAAEAEGWLDLPGAVVSRAGHVASLDVRVIAAKVRDQLSQVLLGSPRSTSAASSATPAPGLTDRRTS